MLFLIAMMKEQKNNVFCIHNYLCYASSLCRRICHFCTALKTAFTVFKMKTNSDLEEAVKDVFVRKHISVCLKMALGNIYFLNGL